MSKIEVDEIVKQSGSTLTLGGPGTAVTLGSGATQTRIWSYWNCRLVYNC